MHIGIVVLAGMRAGHALRNRICGEGRKTTTGMAGPEHSRTAMETVVLIPLDLRSGRSKQIDVHARRCPVGAAGIRSHTGTHVAGKVGV